MRFDSLLILSLVLFASLAAAQIKDIAIEAHATTRNGVEPPCSPIARNSPCRGRAGNKLPSLTYDDALAASLNTELASCPLSRGTFNGGENFYLTRTKGITAEALIQRALAAWSAKRGYDATTGTCGGTPCDYYAQMVNAATTRFGCAVNPSCPFAVAACRYDVAWIKNSPAYPPLVVTPKMTTKFESKSLKIANVIRKHAWPKPVEKLPELTWDSTLAAEAKSVANSLRSGSYPASKKGVLVYFNRRKVYPNAAVPAFWRWARSCVLYNIYAHRCERRNRPRRGCGTWTQLASAGARKIGCAQSISAGHTAVVCLMDKKEQATNGIDLGPSKPYIPRPRRRRRRRRRRTSN